MRLLCLLLGHRWHYTDLKLDGCQHAWRLCFRCDEAWRDGVKANPKDMSGEILWAHGP